MYMGPSARGVYNTTVFGHSLLNKCKKTFGNNGENILETENRVFQASHAGLRQDLKMLSNRAKYGFHFVYYDKQIN